MAARKKQEAEETTEVEREEPRPQEGSIEIELDDDDDDADDDEEPAAAAASSEPPAEPGVRPSKRKRANGYKELETRAEAAERRAREAEEALHRSRLESYQYAQRPQPQAPQEDQDEAEYNALAARGRDLVTIYNALHTQHKGQIPQAELDRLQKEADGITRKQQAIVYRVESRRQQPDPQVAQQQQLLQQVQARYPDVVANRQAFVWALAEAQKLIAKGVPNSWEMSDHVMDLARAEFGIGKGKQPAADPVNKQRLTGIRSAASATQQSGKRTFTMTQKDREMADQAFGHIPVEKRYKHYAQRLIARRAKSQSRGA